MPENFNSTYSGWSTTFINPTDSNCNLAFPGNYFLPLGNFPVISFSNTAQIMHFLIDGPNIYVY